MGLYSECCSGNCMVCVVMYWWILESFMGEVSCLYNWLVVCLMVL